MAVKTFTTETLTSADTNTYLANSGLVYVTSATIGTTVSSVTVSSAFSATYDNYKIVISGGVCSTSDAGFTLQFGATATGYKSVLYYQDWSGSAVAVLGSQTAYAYTGRTGSNGHSAMIEIITPFLAKNTSLVATGSSPTYNTIGYSILNNTTSYTAFTITTSAGTVTGGTITVYGYRNS